MKGIVIRLACVLAFLYSISLRDADHWPEAQKSRNQYGGHCRFLTFLNVCLSIITSVLFILGTFNKSGLCIFLKFSKIYHLTGD